MVGAVGSATVHFIPEHGPDGWRVPDSVTERIAAGRKFRSRLPRRALGALTTAGRDPLRILEEQNATRLPYLLPLRAERMSQSPFAFYRGTAAIMAADFAADDHSGVLVPSCGDAHLSNFGFYASPQRTLVFDLNDFDEAAWGPWEWDLKRLVASVVIAGQATSRDEPTIRTAVLTAVRLYARALRAASGVSPLDRYYAHLDAEAGIGSLSEESQRVVRKAIKQARRRTGERAAQKLTVTEENGRMRFVESAPTMTPLEPELKRRLHSLLHQYLESASPDIELLMRHYTVSDVIRRVVGVGSVGTRCTLSLLQDGNGHSLLMQAKEANQSVLEQYGGITQPRALTQKIEAHGQGIRVVGLQRVLQAVSDPFLGHVRFDDTDLYVRQFHDMKGSIEAEHLDDEPFVTYAQACAVTLSRAHSQSPLSSIISGYVGGGRQLGEVLLDWGYAYAALSRSDYERFVAAHTGPSGTLPALG